MHQHRSMTPAGFKRFSASMLRCTQRSTVCCGVRNRVQPAIILVEPIMGENIGAAARAMKNFGLSDLRLVSPKDGWPNHLADVCASNALDVVKSARVFDTLDEALADLTFVYAATARTRFMNKDYVLSRDLHEDLPMQHAVGIMFGRESNGLSNAEVARADKIVTIDANPDYPVLNLAQSVVIMTYELYNRHAQGAAAVQVAAVPGPSGLEASPATLQGGISNEQALCTKGDLDSFLSALEGELEAASFFEADDRRRASVSINIRNLFTRIPKLNKREVSMLRGMLNKLVGRRSEHTTSKK